MLKLRKGLLFTLLMCSIFPLIACDYSYYLYHNTDGNEIFLNKDVISIDLIMYESLTAQNDPLGKYKFDVNKLEMLKTLDADNFERFVNGLIKIGGLSGKQKEVLKSPIGEGIRIIYNDGSFTLITVTVINNSECVFLGEYNMDEEIGMTFGISAQDMIDDFKALIDEYFVR